MKEKPDFYYESIIPIFEDLKYIVRVYDDLTYILYQEGKKESEILEILSCDFDIQIAKEIILLRKQMKIRKESME